MPYGDLDESETKLTGKERKPPSREIVEYANIDRAD